MLTYLMKAKFSTMCIVCNGKIQPGKEIAKNSDDQWVHKYCVEDADNLP